jgi:DNA-binding protein YbaB
VTALWDKQIEQLMAEYQRHRSSALDFQQKLREVTAHATSAKGLVTVVVGAQAEVRSIVFHSRAYRTLAPAELAQTLLDTIERARNAVLQQVMQAMPGTALGGVTYEDVLGGRVDLTALLPEDLADRDIPLLSPPPAASPARPQGLR